MINEYCEACDEQVATCGMCKCCGACCDCDEFVDYDIVLYDDEDERGGEDENEPLTLFEQAVSPFTPKCVTCGSPQNRKTAPHCLSCWAQLQD